jgi:hypothetical protein
VGGANDDEEDIEYGREYVHTADAALEEARKLIPVDESDIWPHWSEGVPGIRAPVELAKCRPTQFGIPTTMRCCG